jgi:hypothetical protein
MQTLAGHVHVKPGVFPPGMPVEIEVSVVNSATYVKDYYYESGTLSSVQPDATETTKLLGMLKRSLWKRSAITPYEVIENGDGSIIGQLVGNGRLFTFATMPTQNIEICLEPDINIPIDETMYPVKDFVIATGSVLSVPLGVEITFRGGQYCGYVSPFLSASFLPVLRQNVTLLERTFLDVVSSTGEYITESTDQSSPTNVFAGHEGEVNINEMNVMLTETLSDNIEATNLIRENDAIESDLIVTLTETLSDADDYHTGVPNSVTKLSAIRILTSFLIFWILM